MGKKHTDMTYHTNKHADAAAAKVVMVSAAVVIVAMVEVAAALKLWCTSAAVLPLVVFF